MAWLTGWLILILEFFPDRLPTLPYGLNSNITKLLANMLTKPSVFYYFDDCISKKYHYIILLLYVVLISKHLYLTFTNEHIVL